MPPLSGIDALGAAASALTSSTRPPQQTDGAEFGASITGAVDELRAMQSTSNELAVAAVTGDLDDIHSAMIASSRASVTLELVAAVRNKGIEAFNDIMRMQA
ncbi:MULTISPECIES: flagellar hook-basal body complex protein FliE [Microbacterium]|uniref:Flagellar hook-basal body complex protein FliE n=1 Tax=Microbacterium plantarum TaxID=1816425 RepID=A0ABV5ENU6_9MICO|nr:MULTISPECIES: flagellar hook-basal body complex protein FliE [Microbacterium]RAZ32532.1 flagellar hook-basal body complex protein FliE [Microbacterium sp. SMR1]